MLTFLLLACAARSPAPEATAPAAPPAAVSTEDTVSVDLDALMSWSDPAAGEAAYRAVLDRYAGAAQQSVWTRIARAQGLQRRYDEARATLDQVEAALQALGPAVTETGEATTDADLAEAWTRLHLERGRVFNSSGDAETSVRHFERALHVSEETGLDGLWVDAAHMLGIVLPPDQALEWNLRAIRAAEKSEVPAARRWLGPLYNNTGWTYMDRGEPALALELFEKGVAWREADGKEKPLLVARWTVARAWRDLGRCEEALPLLESLHQRWAELGEPDAYVIEEQGECLWALGRQEEARPYLRQAWEILSQDPWTAEHEAARLASLQERGGTP